MEALKEMNDKDLKSLAIDQTIDRERILNAVGGGMLEMNAKVYSCYFLHMIDKYISKIFLFVLGHLQLCRISPISLAPFVTCFSHKPWIGFFSFLACY